MDRSGEQERGVANDDRDSNRRRGVGLRRSGGERATAAKLVGLGTLNCVLTATGGFEAGSEGCAGAASVEQYGIHTRHDDPPEEDHDQQGERRAAATRGSHGDRS